jgi:hypothetical protein
LPGYSPAYDSPSRASAPPPPDFSSWYDPSPRSGSSQPWSGAARQPGAASQPGRRPGLSWKIALALLGVLGAAAGATTVALLRHGTTSTPPRPSSSYSYSSTATLPPATLQILDAINNPPPRSLPAGWTAFTHHASGGESAGFTIAYPANWTYSTSGHQTYLRDPSANVNTFIDLTPHTYPNDMLAEAQYIKTQSLAQNHFPGYSEVGLAATPIRGTRGSYWKFTWQDHGVRQEAIDLLFVKDGQSYALYMTAPASMWTQTRPTFDEELETFAPLT